MEKPKTDTESTETDGPTRVVVKCPNGESLQTRHKDGHVTQVSVQWYRDKDGNRQTIVTHGTMCH